MREIKFRAWIYDEYEEQWEMTYDLAFEEYNPVNDQLASVENLMQYTGLKDNNGKDLKLALSQFYRQNNSGTCDWYIEEKDHVD